MLLMLLAPPLSPPEGKIGQGVALFAWGPPRPCAAAAVAAMLVNQKYTVRLLQRAIAALSGGKNLPGGELYR